VGGVRPLPEILFDSSSALVLNVRGTLWLGHLFQERAANGGRI
jgi:hypothetical protein